MVHTNINTNQNDTGSTDNRTTRDNNLRSNGSHSNAFMWKIHVCACIQDGSGIELGRRTGTQPWASFGKSPQ